MDLNKIYRDSDGNMCNILQMVSREHEWAANRIQVGEEAISTMERSSKLKACYFCCNREMCGTCLNFIYFKHVDKKCSCGKDITHELCDKCYDKVSYNG